MRDKYVTQKEMLNSARKQEGTSPYTVPKVTSSVTFCKVRGNSLSIVA